MTEIAYGFSNQIKIVNYLDENVLPQLTPENECLTDKAIEQVDLLVKAAELGGADAILLTCSSISEYPEMTKQAISIPIYKIDEPMLRTAAKKGGNICVMATAATTVGPTIRQLKRYILEEGSEASVERCINEAAFNAFQDGDIARHNTLIIDKVEELATNYDIVILAQASTSFLVPELSEEAKRKILSSPKLGIETAITRLLKEGEYR